MYYKIYANSEWNMLKTCKIGRRLMAIVQVFFIFIHCIEEKNEYFWEILSVSVIYKTSR